MLAMDLTQITPDSTVFWRWGWFELNATMVWTWVVMAVLAIGSALVTRRLADTDQPSRWQALLEMVVEFLRDEIRQISNEPPERYLAFVGTLFLFTAMANALTIVPGYVPPTASLSTAAALALCVFVAVPIYGIIHQGVLRYLKHYVKPSPLMLPFNVIGELSRTLALAVRLFGNVMSGTKVVGILVALTPFLFPVVLQLLGLLTGLIQAYIFAVLAMVYIASGTRARARQQEKAEQRERHAEEAEPSAETSS